MVYGEMKMETFVVSNKVQLDSLVIIINLAIYSEHE